MHLYRIQQISESHCGPAVLQMLLGSISIFITQEEITRAAGVETTIEEHGTQVNQLAKACQKLAPQTQFWHKSHSSLDDIRFILERGYGVGVEWQGLFYESEEEEEEEDDAEDYGEHGHFSIVSFIDEDREALIIVDPYKDFSNQDRILEIKTFLHRWWDKDDKKDPETGKTKIINDDQVLFFVTPINETFPSKMGFKKAKPSI